MVIHSSPAGWRRESEMWKWQNCFIEIKSLIDKAKMCAQVKQKKKSIHSFPSVEPYLGNPSHVTVTWENRCYSSQPPSFLFLLQLLLLITMSYSLECPFGHLWSAVPAVSPHIFSGTPTDKAMWETETSLMLLSSSYNIRVLSTLFWSKILNIMP